MNPNLLGAATIDPALLVDEALSTFPGLLPPEVARRGYAGLDDETRELLQERGITRFSESDYTSALREVLRRLTDNRESLSENTANAAARAAAQPDELTPQQKAALEREATLAVAQQRLREGGISAPSYEELGSALVDAEFELKTGKAGS